LISVDIRRRRIGGINTAPKCLRAPNTTGAQEVVHRCPDGKDDRNTGSVKAKNHVNNEREILFEFIIGERMKGGGKKGDKEERDRKPLPRKGLLNLGKGGGALTTKSPARKTGGEIPVEINYLWGVSGRERTKDLELRQVF